MISIIIPVYNAERYIEKCIQSLIHQTYRDIEILLINDGSTDNSLSICLDWQTKDARVKAISKPNGGVGSARNMGLDLANGEYIFFIDADDWLAPSCLEEMINKMSSEIDMVICDYAEIQEPGYNLDIIYKHKHLTGVLSNHDVMRDLYHAQIYPRVIWGKLYRKELWKGLRFNSMKYTEDTYAMIELLKKTNRAYVIDNPLYFYLLRANSASHILRTEQMENAVTTFFYAFQIALQQYPECISLCANEYLGIAYVLLKKYEQEKNKKRALQLINNMRFSHKNNNKKSSQFSHRVLILPPRIIYFLIKIKNRIQ